MQLRDRGLLSLDDPVVKYVPELRLVHNPFGDISQVTIRHLMSHSAGFRASTWPWGGDKPWHPFEPTAWEQLVAMLPYTDVQFAPGIEVQLLEPRRHLPRPHHPAAVGRRLRGLRHQEHPDAARDASRTFFDRAPYHLRRHRSHSYLRDDAGLQECAFDFDTGITVSNGGLNAPFGDMAKLPRLPDRRHTSRPEYETVRWRAVRSKKCGRRRFARPKAKGAAAATSRRRCRSSSSTTAASSSSATAAIRTASSRTSTCTVPSRSAYIVSFNTDASSASSKRPRITRDVDDAVRDRFVEALGATR